MKMMDLLLKLDDVLLAVADKAYGRVRAMTGAPKGAVFAVAWCAPWMMLYFGGPLPAPVFAAMLLLGGAAGVFEIAAQSFLPVDMVNRMGRASREDGLRKVLFALIAINNAVAAAASVVAYLMGALAPQLTAFPGLLTVAMYVCLAEIRQDPPPRRTEPADAVLAS